MTITTFVRQDLSAAAALWNACVQQGDMGYAPLEEQRFSQLFLENPHAHPDYLLAAREDGALIGFAAGLVKRQYLQGETFENTPAYLTMVLTAPGRRRQGVGKALLAELERRFAAAGKRRVAITYRNPVNLTWQVPGTDAQHNNAPGVDRDSAAYAFFSAAGYRTLQVEDGMYLPLRDFSLGEKVRAKEARLAAEGIFIGHYDPARHHGFEELFDALHGEVWRQTMRDNAARPVPLPVLIAADGGAIVGFAGPIDREANGRGWFNGIATHPAYERRGIATVLFHRLMAEFKEIGAQYSTLFTDEGNPALHLYKSVGFTVARSFAVMEKEV